MNALEQHDQGANEARNARAGERDGKQEDHAGRRQVEQHQRKHELPERHDRGD